VNSQSWGHIWYILTDINPEKYLGLFMYVLVDSVSCFIVLEWFMFIILERFVKHSIAFSSHYYINIQNIIG